MEQKKLFLLDAYALIFRGYYAFIKNPRINSKGLDTSAIMGFMNSLLDVIKRERPHYIAVAFDKEGSAARCEMYPEYKANREETPEAIRIAIPYIKELLAAMHIPTIEVAGIEADDLIGTLAKQAEKEGFTVYMVTPDKDYAQLVSENIFVYRPARMGNGIEIWGVDEVKQKFEIEHPEQVIDYLGMMGDTVDNIPGLPGVGDKTAKKLLSEFGSMENLLANTDKLKGKMKEKIEASREIGLLSKELARIMLDCPVTFDAELFEARMPDIEKTDALFQELEFRRMKEQFEKTFLSGALTPPDEDVSTERKSNSKSGQNQLDLFETGDSEEKITDEEYYARLTSTPHFYQVADTESAVQMLIKNLLQQKEVCFDTETTSLDAQKAELVGIAFSYKKGTAFYVPFPENQEEAQKLLEKFRSFFESEKIVKIGQNLKYDIKILNNYNMVVKGFLYDTMIAHYLINPDMRHNMDVLAETYLRYTPQSIETLIGKKGKNQKSMRDVVVSDVVEYAGEDADITLQLKEIFEEKLEKSKTKDLFETLESPLVEVLADMENEGIRIDIDYLRELSAELSEEANTLQEKIFEQAGETFNLASPKQLGDVLFDKLKIGKTKPKKTKTGQYATGEEVLSLLANEYGIVRDILEWRQIVKLQNTYVDALPNQVSPVTQRVHTDYMQAVAATGRLSSNNPNLQNIPIRTERGQKVRKAFIARDENHVLMSADYSQIELRIIASLSEEPTMIASFRNKEDIHRATAARVFQVALEDVTREQRSHAKTVNFGIIYGVSAFGLSQQTSLSRADSKELIDTYYKTYPKLRAYIQNQIDYAREYGYVQTVLGRRRYLKDIHSQNAVVRGGAERNAVNAPIQGSAADIIKLAMIAIHKRLNEEQLETKMLLQVHDELVFDVPKSEIEIAQKLIQKEMEKAFELTVPLEVEIGIGDNWLDAH